MCSTFNITMFYEGNHYQMIVFKVCNEHVSLLIINVIYTQYALLLLIMLIYYHMYYLFLQCLVTITCVV